MLKLGKSWENRNKLATLSEILHSSCDVWSPLLQQVKTYFWGVLGFHCHGPQVQLMVGELKSHKPWGHCQKKKFCPTMDVTLVVFIRWTLSRSLMLEGFTEVEFEITLSMH